VRRLAENEISPLFSRLFRGPVGTIDHVGRLAIRQNPWFWEGCAPSLALEQADLGEIVGGGGATATLLSDAYGSPSATARNESHHIGCGITSPALTRRR
jgi:hypothetical protein